MSGTQRKNLTLLQGADFSEAFTAYDDDGIPIDLTGGAVDMQIREWPLGGVWASSNSSPASITITPGPDATAGQFTAAIAAAWTQNLYFREAFYDVRLTKAGAVTRLFEGTVRLDPQITR